MSCRSFLLYLSDVLHRAFDKFYCSESYRFNGRVVRSQAENVALSVPLDQVFAHVLLQPLHADSLHPEMTTTYGRIRLITAKTPKRGDAGTAGESSPGRRFLRSQGETTGKFAPPGTSPPGIRCGSSAPLA